MIKDLGDKGEIKIEWSASTNEITLVVNGKEVDMNEFAEILEAYEGWTMKYIMEMH